MKISIIGAGYVGLVTGVGLALRGHKVICIDIDRDKVEMINKGKSPIREKDLSPLLKTVLAQKHFMATTDLKSAVLNTEITFIAVPTPTDKNNKIDLSYIKKVVKEIGSALAFKKNYHTVAVKSTVVPETTRKVIIPLLEKKSGKKVGQFGVGVNPEFLREGKAVEDFLHPDRIIIGEVDKKSGNSLSNVYQNFKTDILRMSLENAEMTKYVNNALLATLISFSNEIANICEKIPGANISEVLKGIYLDKRLNPIINRKRVNPEILTYIFPGCGFGGSCLPKDLIAFTSFAQKKRYRPLLLSAVSRINKARPRHITELLEKELKNLEGRKIAVLGLAFKPGTDDIRESPAIPIIKKLISKNAVVSIYDPAVNPSNLKNLFSPAKLEICGSLSEAIRNKDGYLLVTKWNEFKRLIPELLNKEMHTPLLIDGRNLFTPKDFRGKIKYVGIGLGSNQNHKNVP